MDIDAEINVIIASTGISREEIRQKLDEEIASLSGLIDDEGAIIILKKKYGLDVSTHAGLDIPDTVLKNITVGTAVTTIGRVKSIQDVRSFTRKDGGTGEYFSFDLCDGPTTVRVMVWANMTIRDQLKENLLIRISNVQVKANKNGGMELHANQKTQWEYNIKADIPEIGPEKIEYSSIGEIRHPSPLVHVEGTILSIYPPKEYSKKAGGTGQRASILLQDESDSCFITFWDAQCSKMLDLEEQMRIQLTHLTVKPNYKDASKIDLTATTQTEIHIL
jgi:replication factor A1